MAPALVEMQIARSHIDPQFTSTFVPDMINSFVAAYGAKVRRMVLIDGWFHVTFEVEDRGDAGRMVKTVRSHGWPAAVMNPQF